MAGNGIITIRFEEGGKNPGPQPIDPSKSTPEAEKVTDNNLLETAVMVSLLKKSARQLYNISINEAKYQLNKYFNLTDNYLGQQSMNIALGVINKAWDFGTSIYFGAKAGSKAGPYGAILGAVLAGGISIISTSQQISHNYEQERIKINQMDAQLSFNRQRAGYSLTAGSIGENR